MYMRGPPGMPRCRLEHGANRPIVRDGVRHGSHANKGIAAVLARVVTTPQVCFRCFRVLYAVQTVVPVLPDVQLGTGDWLAVRITNVATHDDGGPTRPR